MNKTAINPAILEADATSSQRGVWSGLWRQFRSDFGAQVGLLLTLIIIVVAVFADVIAPYGPTDGDFSSARLPPAWVEGGSMDHLLGTDQLGQDIFTYCLWLTSFTDGQHLWRPAGNVYRGYSRDGGWSLRGTGGRSN